MTVAAALVAVAALVLVAMNLPETSQGETATSQEERSLDLPLTYLDGSTGNISEFRDTPVVLNFWASWCPTCIAEMPDFEEVHQQLGDQVVFLGVNMQEVSREAAEALVRETGVTYRLVDDPTGEIFRRFGGVAMPTTVFITAEGTIAQVHAGAIFADDLLALIESTLLN